MRQEIFVYERFVKLPLKYENGKVYPAEPNEKFDFILSARKFENIYSVVLATKFKNFLKGLNVLRYLIENQDRLFEYRIKLYYHILLTKKPETNIIPKQVHKYLLSFKGYIFNEQNKIITIRDKLDNFISNSFTLFQVADLTKSSIRRIELILL